MAQATLGIGGLIGLVLVVPVVMTTVPESLRKAGATGGTPTALSPDEFKALQGSTNAPVKLNISFTAQDGYLKTDVSQFVWGIKMTPEQEAAFQKDRPDLFKLTGGEVKYPAVTMGFVIFSPICPHLGCYFAWHADAKRFICPCHNSQFSIVGEHLAGPAPRGLDPLPLREAKGTAEVTWVRYQTQQPTRIVVDYT